LVLAPLLNGLEPSGRGIEAESGARFSACVVVSPNAAHVYQSVSMVAKFFWEKLFHIFSGFWGYLRPSV
jgi:hypothetical protein